MCVVVFILLLESKQEVNLPSLHYAFTVALCSIVKLDIFTGGLQNANDKNTI